MPRCIIYDFCATAFFCMYDGDTASIIAVQRFGSVLTGLHGEDAHIRTLHLSFQEFVKDHANSALATRKLYILEKVHSQHHAWLCVQTLVRECKYAPIIGTGYLTIGEFDPPGIPEVIEVSEQLLHSCEVQIDHLVDIEDPDSAIANGHQMLLILEFSNHALWFEGPMYYCRSRGIRAEIA